MALLELKSLNKSYEIEKNIFSRNRFKLKAVDDVSFTIKQGKTFGLVGESGCGKSTLAKLIVKLINPDAGKIFFDRQDITQQTERKFRPLRQKIQIVFQDPYSSLSPRLKVGQIISEPLEAFSLRPRIVEERIAELIVQMGLDKEYLNRLPSELSGGERQRVGIARALATYPKLVILDEAVSSLDLSTQAQILNLLLELQNRYKLSYLFIAHNLNAVEFIADELAVMYYGQIVETGVTTRVYEKPAHPYTRKLLASRPSFKRKLLNGGKTQLAREGNAVSDFKILGCKFFKYCPNSKQKCRQIKPQLEEVAPGHFASCFYPG
ncbi:MAG: ATP-binding cassette domain-containing protein [Candidatus Omnitrophica bacterium]|nr:ATP-binding cassette domain-containing protein [Candidatus Omnitrophota bacterium]